DTPAKSNVKTLGVHSYQLTGPLSSRKGLAALFGSSGCILLSNSVVTFDRAAATKCSAVITVPKPDIIRLYRACEPEKSVLGSSCMGAPQGEPHLMHGVAV